MYVEKTKKQKEAVDGPFKNGANPSSFCLFSSFAQLNDKYSTKFNYGKSIDILLGTRTRVGMMIGADESTEIWRHPYFNVFFSLALDACGGPVQQVVQVEAQVRGRDREPQVGSQAYSLQHDNRNSDSG